MNRLISCLLGLAVFATPCGALAQSAPDITGAWVVTVESPQGRADIDATFNQVGEKITGEVTSPMGSVNFSGTLIKNDLTINYSLPLQGQTLEVKMAGSVDKETMSGTIDLGGLGQTTWTAKRKPATTAAAAPATAAPAAAAVPAGSLTDVSGKWDITVTTAQGSLPLSGALKQDGEKVTGSITSPLGDVPVAGTMVGTSLKLEFKVPTPQGDMVVSMNGELGPTGLSGKSAVAGLGESDWVGKRVQ